MSMYSLTEKIQISDINNVVDIIFESIMLWFHYYFGVSILMDSMKSQFQGYVNSWPIILSFQNVSINWTSMNI